MEAPDLQFRLLYRLVFLLLLAYSENSEAATQDVIINITFTINHVYIFRETFYGYRSYKDIGGYVK